MNVQEALDAWQAQYSGQAPVGFMLRFSHDAVWTRLHYLGERDGRKPEQDQLIVQRCDAIASALFTGTTVLLLAIDIDRGAVETAALSEYGVERITPPESWLASLTEYLPNAERIAYGAVTMSWRRGCLDSLWLAVARDIIGRVALFCPATGDAFMPYGSEADLFVWGAERRSKLTERFRSLLAGPMIAAPLAPAPVGRRG